MMAAGLVQRVAAQDRPELAVDKLPDSLKKDAHSIVRSRNLYLNIEGPGKATLVSQETVTVFDQNDFEHLNFAAYYDKFVKIDDVEIRLYDAWGRLVKKYRDKDMRSMPVDDGFSLVTDARWMYSEIRNIPLPATAEIVYQKKYRGLFSLPAFYPEWRDQYVMEQRYTIKTRKDCNIRYKNYQCSIQPKITDMGDVVEYFWQAGPCKPYKQEAGSASFWDVAPRVAIAPTRFAMDGREGDMSTWESMGRWQWELIKETTDLSEERKAFFRNLVRNTDGMEAKVKLLYRHMQAEMRYVSIQLGIGGMKPFNTSFVDEKKYGDCKALSNYMRNILEAVGIKSCYAIINAGVDELPVDPEFASSGFNHVILCVPGATDSIWLECTSKISEAGRLGGFTENRYALLVTENGGKLVPTPRSRAEYNRIHTHGRITLEEDGSGSLQSSIRLAGEPGMNAISALTNGNAEEQLQYFTKKYGYIQPDKFQFTRQLQDNQLLLQLQMNYEKIPDFSAGSKHFLFPRMYRFCQWQLPGSGLRKTDFFFPYPYQATDTTEYFLPENYTIESLPRDAAIKFSGGSYSSQYEWDEKNRRVQIICRFELKQNRITPSQYLATQVFLEGLTKDDSQRVIVRRK